MIQHSLSDPLAVMAEASNTSDSNRLNVCRFRVTRWTSPHSSPFLVDFGALLPLIISLPPHRWWLAWLLRHSKVSALKELCCYPYPSPPRPQSSVLFLTSWTILFTSSTFIEEEEDAVRLQWWLGGLVACEGLCHQLFQEIQLQTIISPTCFILCWILLKNAHR